MSLLRPKSVSVIHLHILPNLKNISHLNQPGTVAWSAAMSLGMHAVLRSIPVSGMFFPLRFGNENISTAILPLPLMQEEQLSVKGERIYAA